MARKTVPEVFIIESLRFSDEKNERFEGRIISQMLKLSDKTCRYYYLRTKKELEVVVKKFEASAYRYLHLSCHGNLTEMGTTLDSLTFSELALLLKPHIRDRRLFISSCLMTNKDLARMLMPGSGCLSILGPSTEVGYGDAAILWASLYHAMLSADQKKMEPPTLRAKAQEIANLFRVPMNYYGRIGRTNRYRTETITPAREKVKGGVDSD